MARITSTFARDTDNWTIAGDVNEFSWRGEGGNPAGHLFWRDSAFGDVAYWGAPLKFLGDQSAFKGGRLVFDWYVSNTGSVFEAADVILTGGGLTLYADAPNPEADWTRASIRFTKNGGWHVGSPDGPLATAREIATALRDVADLRIRAEHINGDETGGLDNVAFRSRELPAFAAVEAGAFGDDAAPTNHARFADDLIGAVPLIA